MPRTKFNSCSLEEVDFVEAQLKEAVFDDCSLRGAMFENTQLEKANFETAYAFDIDPAMNSMKKAVFSSNGLAGLLTRYNLDIR